MDYPYRTPNDETRKLDNGIIVRRIRILSTQIVVYSAWEISNFARNHSTITTFDDQWYGTIHSRRDDSTYCHLRGGSDKRIAAIIAHYDANDVESYAAIIAAFPEAATGKRLYGEIEIEY